MEGGSDGGGDDIGEGGFSQSRRAGEEDMLEDVFALFGGLDHEHEAVGDLFLTVEILESRRAESDFLRSDRGINRFLKIGLGHENLWRE